MSTTAEHVAPHQEHATVRIPLLARLSCITATTCGLLIGLHAGVISGAMQFIHYQFSTTDMVEGWIVGAMLAGAAAGALGASVISNALGRKRSLLLSGALFFVGALIACLATSPDMLILARALLGLAIGVESFVVPLYLSEVAPQHIRGAALASFQLMITIGILMAYLINLTFSASGNWQWMLGITMLPASLMILGVLLLPESPHWMASRGREDTAAAMVRRLTGSSTEAHRKMASLHGAIKRQTSNRVKGTTLFLRNRHFRRAVLLGVLIQAMQQLTGINVMIYFAPRIFEMANFHGTSAQLWSTVAVGIVNLLATAIAVIFADRWGRKPSLCIGFATMAVSMGLLSAILYADASTTTLQITAMLSLMAFIAGFALSIGPLAWALCAEIQPSDGRDFGLGCSTIANWTTNMLIGTYALVILNGIGGSATFGLLALANALFLLLTLAFIPETKGIPLEAIERNVMAGKPLRHCGR